MAYSRQYIIKIIKCNNSDQPSAALRGGAEHTRAGVVRARAFTQIFAAPALILAPFIWPLWYFATFVTS